MQFELKIGNKVYQIPDEFTLGEWAKFSQWNMKDPNDWPFLVADALGVKAPGLLIEMKQDDETQFSFLLSLVLSAVRVNRGEYQDQIDEYKMLSLESINLGTWIDLDILASDPKSQDKLFAKLYGMPLKEAQQMPVGIALASLGKFLDWRKSVYRSYTALFDYNDNNQEVDNTPGNSSMTPAHAWYETLMVLCDGKFRNIQSAVERPFREAFNFLAWKKTKMLEEQMELTKAKQKMNR